MPHRKTFRIYREILGFSFIIYETNRKALFFRKIEQLEQKHGVFKFWSNCTTGFPF